MVMMRVVVVYVINSCYPAVTSALTGDVRLRMTAPVFFPNVSHLTLVHVSGFQHFVRTNSRQALVISAQIRYWRLANLVGRLCGHTTITRDAASLPVCVDVRVQSFAYENFPFPIPYNLFTNHGSSRKVSCVLSKSYWSLRPWMTWSLQSNTSEVSITFDDVVWSVTYTYSVHKGRIIVLSWLT